MSDKDHIDYRTHAERITEIIDRKNAEIEETRLRLGRIIAAAVEQRDDAERDLDTIKRDLWAALMGFQAQYGGYGLREQHPSLPEGCVQRIEALVLAVQNAVNVHLEHEDSVWSGDQFFNVCPKCRGTKFVRLSVEVDPGHYAGIREDCDHPFHDPEGA